VITLPEKVRRTLEKVVKEMKVKENVYGIGLFGSWSRGDAGPSSDVDLLILDRAKFNDEYVERIEAGGLFVDLDHVSKHWIHGVIPPEIDQKLYEIQILYHRDWSLTNTKLLMAKSYSSSERIDIRTEAHVVESDIYLSRATSAFSREDFQSAHLFAIVAFESILKVLIEVTLEPFSNSRFLEKLEISTQKLSMHDLYEEYLKTSRLDRTDETTAKEKVRLFKAFWDEIRAVTSRSSEALESVHCRVRMKLSYYLTPAFLSGAVMRAGSLTDSGRFAEASHYLADIFLDLMENYVWLKSSTNKVKIDYTTMLRSLRVLGESNYENVTKFLGLVGIDRSKASETIDKARATMRRIRADRKTLIKNLH
jgi:predicted nucleotidyltransferase